MLDARPMHEEVFVSICIDEPKARSQGPRMGGMCLVLVSQQSPTFVRCRRRSTFQPPSMKCASTRQIALSSGCIRSAMALPLFGRKNYAQLGGRLNRGRGCSSPLIERGGDALAENFLFRFQPIINIATRQGNG